MSLQRRWPDLFIPHSGGNEPLLLIWPSREYCVGDRVIVDGKRRIISRIIMDTGTVLRAELADARSALSPNQPEGE